ncbi:AgrD family cyclic lactone autoinducer peptide [Paenibacillus ferrarius]|nr:cyclic lactone autoinducer peptide [Paenibacillus ferrarius]
MKKYLSLLGVISFVVMVADYYTTACVSIFHEPEMPLELQK